MDKYLAFEPINGLEILKSQYTQYFENLYEDELAPINIMIGLRTIQNDIDMLKDVFLLYKSKLIILRNNNRGNVFKSIVDFADINYITVEGIPNPIYFTIEYFSGKKEVISYDLKNYEIVNSFLIELRKLYTLNEEIRNDIEELYNPDSLSFEENLVRAEKGYYGASIARKTVINNSDVIVGIMQRKVYNRALWIVKEEFTQTHYTILCKNEIIIFIEKPSAKKHKSFRGNLIFIPIRALKSTSVEATGKGMILRYQFASDIKYELFYENEKTDYLIKIMSFLNGRIGSEKEEKYSLATK